MKGKSNVKLLVVMNNEGLLGMFRSNKVCFKFEGSDLVTVVFDKFIVCRHLQSIYFIAVRHQQFLSQGTLIINILFDWNVINT